MKQESKEISKMHGRMSKDLATIAGKKKTCPFALVVKALSSYDAERLGFVKVIDTDGTSTSNATAVRRHLYMQIRRGDNGRREITRCVSCNLTHN